MNWAVDREFIVNEIFAGLAIARYTLLTTAFPDYARYAAIVGKMIAKYGYNLAKATEVIDAEMVAMGASKGADGKWQFGGKPVVVIALIRPEDKRKEVGDYFATQLETLGFTVDRQYKVRSRKLDRSGKAILIPAHGPITPQAGSPPPSPAMKATCSHSTTPAASRVSRCSMNTSPLRNTM